MKKKISVRRYPESFHHSFNTGQKPWPNQYNGLYSSIDSVLPRILLSKQITGYSDRGLPSYNEYYKRTIFDHILIFCTTLTPKGKSNLI